MKELEIIERLAQTARKEVSPFVDVTQSVIQHLMRQEEPIVSSWWLVTTSLATIISLILFSQICFISQDPLIELFESIRSLLL